MNENNRLTISINYAGMQLDVVKNNKGEDCTPLKPIVELFGLRWEQQRKKVTGNPYLVRFLGVCTLLKGGAGGQKREETCILISRGAAYLMSINPERVRVNGNESSAEFLEQKLEEWADALHDYEQLGAAFNLNHARAQDATRRQYMLVNSLLRTKTALASSKDRQLLDRMIGKAAGELGIPYQPDLLDQAGDQ
jgi:hypothetical protein